MAKGQKDRLYFATDNQDRTIQEYLETGILPTGIPPETVAARDRIAAIGERLERAERRFWDKEGNPLRFWALLARLDGRMQKVQKENDKEVQDLVMFLARRAWVL